MEAFEVDAFQIEFRPHLSKSWYLYKDLGGSELVVHLLDDVFLLVNDCVLHNELCLDKFLVTLERRLLSVQSCRYLLVENPFLLFLSL